MSEPIQSISQGNYILQGTVATSAGIVGDGSTQNPLRADETVLWEGTPSSSSYKITLSEAKTNFDRIMIYLKVWERTFCITLAGNSNFQIGTVFAFQDGYLQAVGTRWSTSDNIEFSWVSTITTYWGESISNGWVSDIVPIKIVGINRISGGNA